MKNKIVIIVSFLLFLHGEIYGQQERVNYVNSFANVNHPQVAYWFFSPSMMDPARYKGKIDSFVAYSKYTLIFLTARGGCDFTDAATMHPVFKGLVQYAHQKGLKIGLQIWKPENGTLEENTDRLIQEEEVVLDNQGRSDYHVVAKGARIMSELFKSELFRIYAFRKTAAGFYDPATLKDITSLATSKADTNTVSVTINASASLKGYTAYILTQHYYHSCSNFSSQSVTLINNAFSAYADIPFDGVGLDEYKNLRIARQPVLVTTHDTFRERLYSVGMAKKMKASTGFEMDKLLFNMRYAPSGKPEVRMRAINEYMNLLRTGTLAVEAAVYDLGKKLFGPHTFIGLHDTFHNNLDMDEVWQTGISWWNIKRDYGHTDEETATPIQVGIGMSYPMNAMYNMYYNKSLERIWTKALYDLRFGIRTHYHAANDIQGWGVSIDAPETLQKINPVENAARLLNRFNPRFPAVKLLVVYGMESLCNWYPDTTARGLYDINSRLNMDKKSEELWKAGYLNASIPVDEIEDGRLKMNSEGKPVLNGYVFDAILFIAPQYSKPVTFKFLQSYVNKGGKLLIDGDVTNDFYGNNSGKAWLDIKAKAVGFNYSLPNIEKLGIHKNDLADGVANGNGEYTFTSIESLQSNTPATFSFTDHGNNFTGTYKGLAAIKVDSKGNIVKLAAAAFGSVFRNGKEIFHLSQPADVFISVQNGTMNATIADETRSIKLMIDK
ncbi:MAG: hypothetical protein JSU05_03605 [Bacteroidetes bacterium]|nr:hypothetical protein [Bacteroidota bacterium]